ncbi:MAG: sugar ABC transporter permease [Chloroflexi bacterium]|nr:sugar ABC transporter permease [Chloroflexota bacterium]MBI3169355.1 sugar ABC transporter permease [Chloroflexota bacterium]
MKPVLDSKPVRLILAVLSAVVIVFLLQRGFVFLRDTTASKIVIVVFAVLWGVGGVALLYTVANWIVELLPGKWVARVQPIVFVGPGLALLFWFLAIPVFRTLVLSFRDPTGQKFEGFGNYVYAFTNRIMIETFRNNFMWMVFGTFFCVSLGLIIAVLADKSRYEAVYKAIIFMPMAISFVGAGVIWKFVYTYKGEGVGISEIGLLNAIVLAFGGQSQPWLILPPYNNFFLIVIMVWLQTGFAMVILSSAIKGIPAELLEAARIDGASEFQIFFGITIPSIQGTLITVTTTIVIFSLKLFDIVRVMTGGNNGTNVIANEFYLQRFTYSDAGQASAIAVILLIAVIPVMIYNLRQFRESRAF